MTRRHAFLATVGSGVDLVGRQGAQFLVVLILARLATPVDFGTVALLGSVVLVAVVLGDAGLSTAILQAADLDDESLDTAFWLTAAAGALLTLVALGAAVPLSALLGRPGRWPVAAFLGLAVLATSLGTVPTALLVKQRAFGRLLAVGVLGSVLSGTAAVVVATSVSPLWGLAVQMVAMPAASTVLLWAVGDFRPHRRLSRRAAERLLGAGRWVFAANAVDVSFARVQAVVVGTMFGAADLGRYQRADSTQQLSADTTATIVGRVALPLFARSSGRPDLLRTGFLTGIRSVTAVNAPVMALLAALSAPLVTALYGPRWSGAAPLLSVLAMAGILWPLHSLAVNLLYAQSRNREVFRIDLVKKLLAVTALSCGAWVGLQAVAWAQVAFGFAAFVVNGAAVRRAIGVRVTEQLRETVPSIVVAAAAGVSVFAVAGRWEPAAWVEVVTLGPAGLGLYLTLSVLFRVRGVLDLLALVRPVDVRSVHG